MVRSQRCLRTLDGMLTMVRYFSTMCGYYPVKYSDTSSVCREFPASGINAMIAFFSHLKRSPTQTKDCSKDCWQCNSLGKYI